jgi:hypothetical protein
MDAINANHGPSQADLLVQQNAQQAAAPSPQPAPATASEETGETVESAPETATEGNLGRHVNTFA